MSELERWRETGLAALGRHLAGLGGDPDASARVLSALRDAPAPGVLAFLAGAGVESGREALVGDAFVQRVARAVAEDADAEAADTAHVVGEVLRGERSPAEVVRDPELRRRLLERGVAEALEAAGVPATPEEIRRIALLLETGELFADVGAATAAILVVLPRMPLAIARDALRSPTQVPRVVVALAADLGDAATDLPAVLADVADGRLDDPPPLLTRTLRVLFELASLEAAATTLRAWLAPENETVRLAILLYARANGLPLEPSDLDALHAALDPEQPDLGPLWIAAWEHLAVRLGTEELVSVLGALPASTSERERE